MAAAGDGRAAYAAVELAALPQSNVQFNCVTAVKGVSTVLQVQYMAHGCNVQLSNFVRLPASAPATCPTKVTVSCATVWHHTGGTGTAWLPTA